MSPHFRTEGVFVPLSSLSDADPAGELFRYFSQRQPRQFQSRISEPDAQFVDAVLRKHHLAHIGVDKEQLGDCWEAWVHVRIAKTADDPCRGNLRGFGECRGILTWENSD